MSTDHLDAEIRRIVDAAPPLTSAQRDKLAALLAADEPAPTSERRNKTLGGGVVG